MYYFQKFIFKQTKIVYRESYWCYQIPTPGVSLGVLSPQGRHSATYTEHMPNE